MTTSLITRTTTTITTKITRLPSPNVIIKQHPPAWEQLEFEFDSVS